MRHPDPSMLVRIAIADAVASATEYIRLPREAAIRSRALALSGYVAHPTHGHVAGRYTDDAEMSVANARVLVEYDPPFVPFHFADAWVREFERGGRRSGYARRFQAFLECVTDGHEFLDRIVPRSDKNGAAMRASVFGVLPTVEETLAAATTQAAVTHDTPAGRFSSRAVALLARFSLYEDAPLRSAPGYALRHLPAEDAPFFDALLRNWRGDPVTGGRAPVSVATVQAAATLVARERTLMGMLRRCMEWGGDTDSVAAIAWGIASPRFQDERLPDWMERDLEGGSRDTGAPALRALGERLMSKYA